MKDRPEYGKATLRVDGEGMLAKWAELRGRDILSPVAAIMSEKGEPVPFVANELMVESSERELIDELVRLGASVVEPGPLLPTPPEIRRRGRDSDDPFPAPVLLRLDRPLPSDARDEVLSRPMERFPADEGNVTVSARGAETAALVARYVEQGRRIGLNLIGEPVVLPHLDPLEEFDPAGAATTSPFTWPSFTGRYRIAEAWQLVESVRAVRSLEPVVWVAIHDNGFWVDNNGIPFNGTGDTSSDLGAGFLGVNLMNEGTPVSGPNGVPCGGSSCQWHGNQMASAATGLVGNNLGAAGSGGTVARPVCFKTDFSASQTLRCIQYCVAWGLDVLNMSWRSRISRGLFGHFSLPDGWVERFQFAHDHGLIMCAAAGNDGIELPENIVIPATRTPGTITVGWLDMNDQAHGSSNHGSSVDIWAPGTGIPVGPDGGAMTGSVASGSSPATALVSGVAAMMRAVNPSITPDDVKKFIVDTGWNGTGKVSKGLDAFAAVMAAIGGKLPDDLAEPNNQREFPGMLIPTSPGSALRPFGSFATHKPQDVDFWRFSINRLSSVDIRLQWYRRLGSLVLVVEAENPANADAVMDLAEGGTAGNRLLTGVLPPGSYLIRISGNANTAYELEVTPRPFTVERDIFEPNDSFDSATRLRFTSPKPPFEIVALGWGPGEFDATLHRRIVPVINQFRINSDFYTFDVPAGLGNLLVPTFAVFDADLPVDVTLFDADRNQIGEWLDRRNMREEMPRSTTCFVRISGAEPTRYRFSIGMRANPLVLPPEVEEAEVIPDWWIKPEFDLRDQVTHFGVEMDGGPREPKMTFSKPKGLASLTLLDAEGGEISTAADDGDGLLKLDTGQLPQGLYYLRAKMEAAGRAPRGRNVMRVVPPKLTG